ncbi:MAG TPA: response regulator [Gemmatimonadales bacterium]
MSEPAWIALTQEHERRYRQLIELAPDAIVVHDGAQTVFANAAAVRLAGATVPDQLVGQPVEAFLEPPYLKAVQQQLLEPGDSMAQTAPPVRDSFRRLDGSRIVVEVRTTVFMDGDLPSVHLVIRDISERLAAEQRMKEVEERLHQAQRMEAVGALAGGVAHEINNMMSVVLGFSDFILRDPGVPAKSRSDARHILRAARRASTVTSQLLSFSRRAFHDPRVIELGTVVRDSEPVVQRLLGANRHLALATMDSPRVRIDPRQLDQVIVNLALNARDAMPVDGTLTIRTEEVELIEKRTLTAGAVIPAGRYGLLVMRDTGVGMDSETQARIFEPFFTTKPVGEGTGLGLAATYGIIKQNDGYIAVASAPDEGAEFSVYLPLASSAVDRERRGSPRPPSKRVRPAGATVLLVEDEPGLRLVAARILKSGGFRILEASNGDQALELVGLHGPPDLVLTDVVMPTMGGAELARRLRARWPSLPILFMSGYSTEALRHQGALDSEAVTIAKPFTPDGLIRSVAAALSRVLLGPEG